MIKMTFNGNQFKKFSVEKGNAKFTPTFNKAVFDVQFLGFIDYKISDIEDKIDIIYDVFLDIFSYNREFIAAVTTSTDQKINDRMSIWKNKLNDVLENPAPYFKKIDKKRELFDAGQKCYYCNQPIDEIDEADYGEGQFYHRICHLETTRARKMPTTINAPFMFNVNDVPYDCDNIEEAFKLLMELVSEEIIDDDYNIERLTTLDFIGTLKELSSKAQVNHKRRKKFKELDIRNQENKKLYVNISGNRSEILEKMSAITSMYSFLSDFEVVK